MTLAIAAGLVWVLLSVLTAALLGRAIRLGDDAAAAAFRVNSIERYLAEQASAPLP